MKARLFLILIFFTILIVVVTNESYDLISPIEVLVFDKKIILNTELTISLIVLGTLLGVLFIGLIEKIFFSKGNEKQEDQ